MKKYHYLFLTALTVLASCSKETDATETIRTESEKVPMVFTAATDDKLGKTTLDNNDFSILWSREDQISVFAGADAAGDTFSVESVSDDQKRATFSGLSEVSGVYYALSPASAGASISGGKIHAALPTQQSFVSGSFAPEANIATACAEDSHLQFKNAGALVGLTVGCDGVTAVKLEALGADDILSGTADIDCTGDEPALSGKSGVNYVRMEGNLTQGSTCYFIVWPGNYAGGFRVTLYRGSQYSSFTKSGAKLIARNDNLHFGTFTPSQWKGGFTVGEALTIRNSAEAGQEVSYISDGYWDKSDGRHFSDNGDNYNYEIFTRLSAGEKFHFRSEGNDIFALNAEGDKVVSIGNASSAAYGAPADGIYRIRLNMSDAMSEGEAHIKQISAVKYSQWSVFGADLSYAGNGVWTYANLPMRRNSQAWNNRYKFNVVFEDGTNQYYGRSSSDGGNPVYGTTGTDYFYVQPCDNTDNWEPCFKFPSECEIDEDRYYGDLSLSFNNAGGHYTHAIVNVRDSRNLPDITPGENMFIGGNEEKGQRMSYITTNYYDATLASFGDAAGIEPNAIGDYDYEVYTYIKEGEKFYFYNEGAGKYFAPDAEGDGMMKIPVPEKAAYACPGEGVWRIRANFSTGKASLRRIGIVNSALLFTSGCSYELSYAGRGVWEAKDQVISWGVQSWDAHMVRYVFNFWYNMDNAGDNPNIWQRYGTVTLHNDQALQHPAIDQEGSYWNIQPYTGDSWASIFYYGKWLYDEDYNSCIATTVRIYMNDEYGHFTHRFSDTKYIGTGSGKMLFDFGSTATGNPTASPDKNGNGWNNIRITTSGGTGSGNGTVFSSLRYTNGVHCGYSLVLKTDFKSNSNGGLTEAMYTADTESALGDLAIGTATGDYFHNDSASKLMTFELQGLDPAVGYRFTFFGSRTGSAGQTRYTRYYADGLASWYGDLITVGPDASQNTDQVVVSDTVYPTAAGTISVSFGKGSTTSGDIYQLNCMKMEEIR